MLHVHAHAHVHVHGHRVCVWIHLPWRLCLDGGSLSVCTMKITRGLFNTQDFAAESMANIITMSSQVLVLNSNLK